MYHRMFDDHSGYSGMIYRSQSLETEWVVFRDVPVEENAVCVLEHWNHMQGTIGLTSIEGAVREVEINLLKNNNNLF